MSDIPLHFCNVLRRLIFIPSVSPTSGVVLKTFCSCIFLLLAMLASVVHAEQNFSTIHGVVADGSGARIPNAHVVVRRVSATEQNKANAGAIGESITNEQGEFR